MNAWTCDKCSVAFKVGIPEHGVREHLKCPDCERWYWCGAHKIDDRQITTCYIENHPWKAPVDKIGRPHIGDLYRQGRCTECSIPLFGYQNRPRDICEDCLAKADIQRKVAWQ